MSNSVVNLFSKQAMCQVMGPIPSNKGALQGWPFINDFLYIVDFHADNLCPIVGFVI